MCECVCMCWGGGAGFNTHHQAVLKTTAGFPRIRLSSDTVYLETMSDSTSIVTCASDHLAISQRFWWLPPWTICQSSWQNSGKSINLADCQFIIKAYNSRTARLKRCKGKAWEKAWRVHALSRATTSEHLPAPTNSEAFWTLPFEFFMEASLHEHNWLNYCPLTDSTSCSSSLIGNQGWDWKFQASKQMVGSIGNQPLFLGGSQKSPH